jgi:hypothetical protein
MITSFLGTFIQQRRAKGGSSTERRFPARVTHAAGDRYHVTYLAADGSVRQAMATGAQIEVHQ